MMIPRTLHLVCGIAFSVALGSTGLEACGPYGGGLVPRDSHLELARQVLADGPEAESAIGNLRRAGPAGLEAMFQVHGEAIQKLSGAVQGCTEPDKDPALVKLRDALEKIARQRDVHTSRLYWYTDLGRAKLAGLMNGRPVLSLRMLGNLDEELSCANSRFFRTTLYANAEVSEFLRQNFILHWESVRPVPVITIDFGDGRKIERTITGNSAHLILDSQGRPVDVIPGLYGPKAFRERLASMLAVAKACGSLEAQPRADYLARVHARRVAIILQRWQTDLRQIGVGVDPATEVAARDDDDERKAAAVRAQARSRGKCILELPLLVASFPVEKLEDATQEEQWRRLASLHSGDARLDEPSRHLLAKKHTGNALAASRVALTKRRQELPILRTIRNFERSLAEDTVINEYRLHRQIHEWFAAKKVGEDPQALTERVYTELFLTPGNDPWLGLDLPDIYSALEGHGVVRSGG